MIRYLGLLLSVCLPVIASAATFRVIPKLPFREKEPGLTLDLYLPHDASQSVPCVMVIQGGGFRPQNGQRFRPFAGRLAEQGFAAALISYRGRPECHYVETLSDVTAAVRFIRTVGPEHGIDVTRIGAIGRSAGGTLTALLAVMDHQDPEVRIQAAVCFAGVFDFVSRFTDPEQLELQPNHAAKLKSNGEWIGTAFSIKDEHWLAASAINHVDSTDPPILLLHAKDDTTVPWIQSRNMHRALKAAGAESELTVYATGGHAVMPKDADSLEAMVTFLRKHLMH